MTIRPSRQFRIWPALGAALSFAIAGAAAAQTIPEGQSCGGLVCDLGLFGHKVAPKPAVEPVPTVPGATAPTVPAGLRKVPATDIHATDASPPRRKPRVAKAAAPQAAKAAVQQVAAPPPAADMPVVSLASPPISAIAMPNDDAAPLAAAPPPRSVPVVAPPAQEEPVVMANPYVYSRPLPFMFQSVDPTQGVQ